jgi:LysR family transcriptional regulator, hydrogen peroxide-inducible genes activator
MTITQLEYLVAVDEFRHFVQAAEYCFVTQPTLSMQIQKLEEDLGVKLFDRTYKPIVPTTIGSELITQARLVLQAVAQMQQIVKKHQNMAWGELKLGIIPTLAPYLLPALYSQLHTQYPGLQLSIKETTTAEILQDLKQHKLDCGLVVTPLKEFSIQETPLFYEELFGYVSPQNELYAKSFIVSTEINADKLWLLEEGHCFRSQIINLCQLKKAANLSVQYETGSIESLKRMVEKTDGITILPELAARELGPKNLKMIKPLAEPAYREISLVTHRADVKPQLLQALQAEILAIIPTHMQSSTNKQVIAI